MIVNIEISKADLRVVIAAREYVARRDHITQPVGHIQSVLDSERWYPDEAMEHLGGCDLVRVPSPSHPFSLHAHCCSACQINDKADALFSKLTGGAK